MTYICVGKLTIIGSDNGLSPARRQAIIWTNAGILLIGLLGTNFSEILIGIQTFSFAKMHLKMSSAKWHPFCLGLNVLIAKETFNKIMSNFTVSTPSADDLAPSVAKTSAAAMVPVQVLYIWLAFNTLRPRQNGCHIPDDIFKCISWNENVWISIKNSLTFVSKGPITLKCQIEGRAGI